jgi:hypothetical protein
MNEPHHRQHDHAREGSGGTGREHGDGGMGRGVTRMPMEQHGEMMQTHHRQTYWVYVTLVLLGFWTMASPVTFGYTDVIAKPPEPGFSPLPLSVRVWGMVWSDLVSGLLLVVFGWRALTPDRPVSLWACCLVGVWLSFAPLVFWSPSPAAYLNASMVGVLVIALTVLVPDMPGMMRIMQPGPEQPPGWTYNPSSWVQRAPMIVLGFAGWLVSRYLAAYQLGYIERVWDPFFGDGTRRVLTSDMSKMWPVSDAALGALSYTIEFLMAWMGGPARWRTMPWMVTFFGIVVIPLGLTHIILVISQPVVVGEWCTLCLLAAAIMLPMIPLTVDEVIAMLQFVAQKKREGHSVWQVFWFGGTVEGGGPDKRSPDASGPLPQITPAMFWGKTAPWTLTLSTLLGGWLMFAPWALGMQGAAESSNHVVGALVITVSVIVMAEVLRAGRFLNALLGLWTIAAPWLLAGAGEAGTWNNVAVGIVLVLLSLPRGTVRDRYAGWDGYIV